MTFKEWLPVLSLTALNILFLVWFVPGKTPYDGMDNNINNVNYTTARYSQNAYVRPATMAAGALALYTMYRLAPPRLYGYRAKVRTQYYSSTYSSSGSSGGVYYGGSYGSSGGRSSSSRSSSSGRSFRGGSSGGGGK
jgi:hypothetical protein